MKQDAIMIPCPGIINEGVFGHSMRDFCWSCAPYWEQFPVCPVHDIKINKSGYCKKCRKFYIIPKKLELIDQNLVQKKNQIEEA